ncbi:Uncharacterised protein [Cedecea neteri]|uniref:Uncharacterized protein n=1 Tax=Cedecea neteri TaxID=158822 RepID=A0A2X2TB72_9ENTR|nr:Uncharacterised protein [Cedecea neteri]
MFTHAAIANLNGLEMMVYNFVIKKQRQSDVHDHQGAGGCRRCLHHYRAAFLPQAQL